MDILAPTDEELQELQEVNQTEVWETSLARAYEDLLRDKRTGADAIACLQWRNGACHCHEVPGNQHQGVPPHNQENYQGKPWCVAHQSQDCDVAHPFITWNQFKARHIKPGLLS